MPVQAARIGTMDLESAIKNYLAQKAPGKMPYLAVVHRLDQPVEGVLVFAKTPGAAGNLSKQMMAGGAGKYYLAVTEGAPKDQEGTLISYLKKTEERTCPRQYRKIHLVQKRQFSIIKSLTRKK